MSLVTADCAWMKGITGSYTGPELRFEEIVFDFLQARFWITSR